jgi:hypothetical protein
MARTDITKDQGEQRSYVLHKN